MKPLKFIFVLSIFLGGLLLNTQRANAQTEAEFNAEFTSMPVPILPMKSVTMLSLALPA